MANVYKLPPDAVWFITGCSSGLGLSLAKLLAAHPTHRLVATARNPSTLSSLLTETNPSDSTTGKPPKVLTLPLDVTSPASVAAALETTLSTYGRVDVLVNNAGYGLSGDTEATLDDIDVQPPSESLSRRVVETDFWGVARLTLHAVRIMRDENPRTGKQGGVIMNVTSAGGFVGFPGSSYYHAAKFAVEGFTESVSKEVRPEWNIYCTILEPGGTQTSYATSSMVRTATHPAYAAPDTPARILEAYVGNTAARKTWSLPENVATAMYELVARGRSIPIRVPLGADSWAMVKGEVQKLDKELDELKDFSECVGNGKQQDIVNFLGSNSLI